MGNCQSGDEEWIDRFLAELPGQFNQVITAYARSIERGFGRKVNGDDLGFVPINPPLTIDEVVGGWVSLANRFDIPTEIKKSSRLIQEGNRRRQPVFETSELRYWQFSETSTRIEGGGTGFAPWEGQVSIPVRNVDTHIKVGDRSHIYLGEVTEFDVADKADINFSELMRRMVIKLRLACYSLLREEAEQAKGQFDPWGEMPQL